MSNHNNVKLSATKSGHQSVKFDMWNFLSVNFVDHSPYVINQLANNRVVNCFEKKELNNKPLPFNEEILSLHRN